jgi:hypothetical protein
MSPFEGSLQLEGMKRKLEFCSCSSPGLREAHPGDYGFVFDCSDSRPEK